MYARYVPPPKGGQATGASVPTPPEAGAFAAVPEPVASAPPADGFSYSRYIPGAKPTPKTAELSKVYFEDEPSPAPAKRKRDTNEIDSGSKTAKKLKNQDDIVAAERTVTQQTARADEGRGKKDKKKRSRKSKRRTAASDSDSDSDSDADSEEDVTASSKPEPRIIAEPSLVVGEETSPDKPKKDKKSQKEKEAKKEKKRKKRAAEEEPKESTQEPEDASMTDVAAPKVADEEPLEQGETVGEEAKEKKTRDREKKKKKKQKTADPAEDNEDEEVDKRHRAVLERKEKSLKLASENVQDEEEEEDLGELHGLEPLPQPEPVNINTSKPTYETLPSWLAEPIRVSQSTRMPFTDLGVLPKASRVLEEKGFKDAFAVQTAAIPLLLPTSKQQTGDVLISAATGSGKTLAYALPIVRDISQGVVTRLRVLVVLPTRELVKQAQDVFELCAKAYEGGDRKRVRIGVSVGSQSLKSEQEALLDKELRYDPDEYMRIQEDVRAQNIGLADLESEQSDPRLSNMEGYIVEFPSKVDVLICTPGRLVEHIEQTPGFNLDYVRWLVVDEADKLLAQSFQGWLELAMEKFKVDKFSARDFPGMDFSGVRKVILSATLTRDLSLLNQLALRRPRLIVLESDETAQIAEHSLPELLKEYAVRVHDTNLKPLYLLELLQGQHMLVATPSLKDLSGADRQKATGSDTSSDTSSDEDDSDTSSDSSLDSDSGPDAEPSTPTPSRSRKPNIPISLIFTKSNESALRLSRLLALLDPSLASHIGTLTSTTPTHIRRKTLRAFTAPSSPIRLLIASDLVARGIDLANLDHVINYDLPPSVAGYVHRVGRTARAGRSGCAWTLVGDDESGWFWGKIAKGTGIRRTQKVERTRIEEMGEERVEEYESALEKLAKEAGR